MKYNLIFCAALVILMITGCASTPLFEQVKDPAEVIVLPGFSLKPPPGTGWYRGRQDSEKVIFARKGENKTQSLIAMAILHDLPDLSPDTDEEFLKMVSRIRQRDPKSKRFETILKKESISHEKSTVVIRFHTRYRDYEAKNKPKTAKYMVTEDFGILWRHPENKNIGLTIGLSQRHLEGDPVRDFEKIANEFIANANIEPFK